MVDLPPPQFDHPFQGRLEIHAHYGGELTAWNGPCFPFLGAYACAKVVDGVCTIWAVKNKLDARLLRHEIGHCNGWRH